MDRVLLLSASGGDEVYSAVYGYICRCREVEVDKKEIAIDARSVSI